MWIFRITLLIVLGCFAQANHKNSSKEEEQPKLRTFPDVVKDEYVVLLDSSLPDIQTKRESFKDWLLSKPNAEIRHELKKPIFVVRVDPSTLDEILARDEVIGVQQNANKKPHLTQPFPSNSVPRNETCTSQSITTDELWFLARINSLNLPTDFTNTQYNYHPSDGDCVKVYVLDTGIRITHTEFGGRAVNGFDAIPDNLQSSPDFVDVDGHGTHVAGIVGSQTYGVAKKVQLVAVRVFDYDPNTGNLLRGTDGDIMAGVEWVIEDHNNRKLTNGARTKSIINMSLGGPVSSPGEPLDTLELSIIDAINAGIAVVVSAGNTDIDTCNATPARLSASSFLIAVGSTTITDGISSFSNFGSCVTILAPGSDIKSSYNPSDTATEILSGTSQASPIVAGILARRMSHFQDAQTPEQLKVWLTNTASDKIDITKPGTPDLLAFLPCTDNSEIFVCNDPHVTFKVKGSDKPLCFDWKGTPGRIYQLVRDFQNDLVINARLSVSVINPNATYIDDIYLRIDQQWIYIGHRYLSIMGRGLKLWEQEVIHFRARAGMVEVKVTDSNVAFSVGEHFQFTVSISEHDDGVEHLNFHLDKLTVDHKEISGILGEPATEEVRIRRESDDSENALLDFDGKSLPVTLTWRNWMRCWLLPNDGQGFYSGHVEDYQVPCMQCADTQKQIKALERDALQKEEYLQRLNIVKLNFQPIKFNMN